MAQRPDISGLTGALLAWGQSKRQERLLEEQRERERHARRAGTFRTVGQMAGAAVAFAVPGALPFVPLLMAGGGELAVAVGGEPGEVSPNQLIPAAVQSFAGQEQAKDREAQAGLSKATAEAYARRLDTQAPAPGELTTGDPLTPEQQDAQQGAYALRKIDTSRVPPGAISAFAQVLTPQQGESFTLGANDTRFQMQGGKPVPVAQGQGSGAGPGREVLNALYAKQSYENMAQDGANFSVEEIGDDPNLAKVFRKVPSPEFVEKGAMLQKFTRLASKDLPIADFKMGVDLIVEGKTPGKFTQAIKTVGRPGGGYEGKPVTVFRDPNTQQLQKNSEGKDFEMPVFQAGKDRAPGEIVVDKAMVDKAAQTLRDDPNNKDARGELTASAKGTLTALDDLGKNLGDVPSATVRAAIETITRLAPYEATPAERLGTDLLERVNGNLDMTPKEHIAAMQAEGLNVAKIRPVDRAAADTMYRVLLGAEFSTALGDLAKIANDNTIPLSDKLSYYAKQAGNDDLMKKATDSQRAQHRKVGERLFDMKDTKGEMAVWDVFDSEGTKQASIVSYGDARALVKKNKGWEAFKASTKPNDNDSPNTIFERNMRTWVDYQVRKSKGENMSQADAAIEHIVGQKLSQPITRMTPTGLETEPGIDLKKAAAMFAKQGNGPVPVSQPSLPIDQQKRRRDPKPLPQDEFQSISFGIEALRDLKVLEETNDVSSIFKTPFIMAVMKTTGIGSDKAFAQMAAADRFRQTAQLIVKGIPSNYDVGVVEKTYVRPYYSQEYNAVLIKRQTQIFHDLVEATISYNKAIGYAIPGVLVARAKEFGIDVDKVRTAEVTIVDGNVVATDALDKAWARITAPVEGAATVKMFDPPKPVSAMDAKEKGAYIDRLLQIDTSELDDQQMADYSRALDDAMGAR